MLRRPDTNLFCGIAAVIAFGMNLAQAHQENRDIAPPIPCAILENYGGSVQLMDLSRQSIVDTVQKAAIPCGGWVSVGAGWAEIRHRDGFKIHFSAGTFVQIPDGNVDGKVTGDSVVLYKGEVFGQAMNGAGSLNVLTANSRARIHNSSAIVVYNEGEELTQLISLRGVSSLENRFQGARKVQIHPGEASELNFKQMRVVPSQARALSYASLKPKLAELHLTDKEQNYALKRTAERSDRKFASEDSVREVSIAPSPVWDNSEKIAKLHSYAGTGNSKLSISRQPAEKGGGAEEESRLLHEHFERSLAGGVGVDQAMLHPEKNKHPHRSAQMKVEDPEAKMERAKLANEAKEKKKLIEELSRVRQE